jgi:hypothetical protein
MRPGICVAFAIVRIATQRASLLLTSLAFLFGFAGPAHAQAWLPPKGHFMLSTAYSESLNEKHYLPNGEEIDVGHTRTKMMGLSAMYAPADRWLIEAGVPYVEGRYTGSRPHPSPVDDGDWHGGITDLHAALHFQALTEPFALAPYIGAVVPLTDYVTMGHAARGRGLNEVWLGIYAGKSLDPWIPGTYVQVRYNYAFVEQVADVAHDRTNADVELGWFITPQLSVRGLFTAIDTHGGIPVPVPPTHPLFPYHDQLAAEKLRNVGGGLGWSLSDSADIYLVYMKSISGENAHMLTNGLTIGFNYAISGH